MLPMLLAAFSRVSQGGLQILNMYICRGWLSNSANAFFPTHNTCVSFHFTVNVSIQFAKIILYVKRVNGEMGTLFTVNTKVRGDAFHCLFSLHLRHFLRAGPAQTYTPV